MVERSPVSAESVKSARRCWAAFRLHVYPGSAAFSADQVKSGHAAHVILFYLAYLVACGFAASSLSQYISAVSSFHVDNGLLDPAK